jgi:serine phosphatase RsbU (regulator of sigma subunit)
MHRTIWFERLFRTPAGRQRFLYWQTLPLARLTFLLLAIFCLFGMVGFIVDLFSLGQKPLLSVILWTAFTGLMGILYLLVLTRKPRYVLVPIALHLLGSRAVVALIHSLGSYMGHPTIDSGVRISAFAVLILSAAACVFFLLFVQSEGRHAVRIQTELSLAHGIQQTLVPVIERQFPRCEVYGISIPSEEVGGDIVDVVLLEDGSVFAYVADVAGHGLSAGILMGMLKTSIRTQLIDLPSPGAVFTRLDVVLPQVKEAHMYATCTALRIFNASAPGVLQVEYAIAGQPALMHASAANQSVSLLSDEQIPLGLLASTSSYQSHRLQVQPNDILLIATDGILEAENEAGQAFGHEPLARLLRENMTSPLPTLFSTVLGELKTSFKQDDDQTMLLIRFLP